ncbi:retrotransposon protein, putative, ty1-copia subclass [Tanacetum coccineum]
MIKYNNRAYLDDFKVASELNASVEEKDSLTHVWHNKLGHISEAKLQVLEKYELIGMKILGGIIRRFKHKAFGKFKDWKQLVENQTRRTIKKLRTDNGLEFYNWEFEQLCTESGIARHLTVSGMSQQNGLAERKNKTLMDKVRCLLIQSGLPKTFWAEATCMTAYLIYRSPSTGIDKKTHMEMCLGHPSEYGMLRVFGCVAYSHVKQGKLDPRAVTCIFLGYPEGVKGYRLYRLDDESPKIIPSRNVVFNESVMYTDTLKDSGACAHKFVEELHVEVELQGLNNRTLEEDHTNHEDGNDELAGDQETNQTPDLTDYQLIDSLRKNKTWELVDHPAREKLRIGIDYNEVFALVVRHTSIRVKLALTVCKDYELEQLDIKTTLLYWNLEEVIYMRQPSGYKQEFEMMELGEAKKILGMEIVRDQSRKILRMPLGGHLKLLLKDFPIKDCDVEMVSKVPYANAVESLMYFMMCTRLDIAYAKATLQHVVALLTTKAEYMALTEAVKEAI